MMSFDEVDEIETFNDPNSCCRPDDEQTYKITGLDGTEYHGLMQCDVIKYTLSELVRTAYDILNAEDDEEAFERAKAYLELMDAIKEEETDE